MNQAGTFRQIVLQVVKYKCRNYTIRISSKLRTKLASSQIHSHIQAHFYKWENTNTKTTQYELKNK